MHNTGSAVVWNICAAVRLRVAACSGILKLSLAMQCHETTPHPRCISVSTCVARCICNTLRRHWRLRARRSTYHIDGAALLYREPLRFTPTTPSTSIACCADTRIAYLPVPSVVSVPMLAAADDALIRRVSDGAGHRAGNYCGSVPCAPCFRVMRQCWCLSVRGGRIRVDSGGVT